MRRSTLVPVLSFALALVAAVSVLQSAANAEVGTNAPPPAGYPTAQVMASFSNSFGGITIRRGFWDSGPDQGFGYDKAYNKHGITHIDAQKMVLRSPNRAVSGLQYRYTAYAREWINGQLNQQIEVWGIYDYRSFSTYYGWPAGNPLGLVTMYCVGYNPRCPSWVTIALRNGTSAATTTTSHSFNASYVKVGK